MNLISRDALDVERWRRIESVLDVALELAPGEVVAYLDRACAGSPELRREVEGLIEADRRAAGFMAVPAAALVHPIAGASQESASLAMPPPARLGRYLVLGELGRGGMGIVYEGRDEALDRRVAIKALPAEVASNPGRLERFLAEAKLLGTLHHPNIAAIHGIEQAGGARYLILERIEGATLSERLRARPLALAEALDVCAQVAGALALAHAQGIVHRDLKPGNVMVTPSGLVKVLDFGLAVHVSRSDGAGAAVDANPRAAGDLAGTVARLGTPGFMSPEQILGRPQDARADLFAFGALLYQCLTGVRAFSGTTAYQVISATLDARVDEARLPARTPAPVRTLLQRALEKDPVRRLADAGEAAAILNAAREAGPRAPGRAASLGPAWLPENATPFVGREREIGATLDLLERARLVTLTGAGGGGKTRLAVEVARAARVDERWFADLAPAADAGAVTAAVAAATEVRETTEARLVDALAARLEGKTALLVLDHADRVLGPCSTLATRLLERCPGLRILATSREWLGAGGEQTLRVPPLSLPDPELTPTRALVGATEAVRMFVACAGAARGGFRLTDANARTVAGICRDLDGMPLAIELTAALLPAQTLETIAADLERRLRRAAPAPEADVAHDPLAAAIQMSHDRLTDDERRFFRALSVFTGGWSLEAAAAVCDAHGDEFGALDLLTRLMDKSLVLIQRAYRIEPRYRFLEPVRHFAAARCVAAREAADLSARHLDWFLAAAERAAPSLLSGSDQARSLASLEADHPNLLGALDACESAAGGGERALRLAGAVWLFWYVRGHFARGREALARALALPGAQAPTAARAQALFAAGGLALFQGDYVEGLRLSHAALDLYRALGDRLGVARSLSHLALCESGDGRYAEAGGRYQEAIEIFREAGDPRRLSAALNNRGVLMRQQGDFHAALANHEEALELLRRADDRDGMIATLVNLGLASVRLGRVEPASVWLDEALAHARDLRAKRAGAAALQVTAEVLLERGSAEQAARLIGAAQALRSAIGLSADPWWRRTQAELAERLRSALGSERFEHLIATGGEISFEQATDEARRALAPGNGALDVQERKS